MKDLNWVHAQHRVILPSQTCGAILAQLDADSHWLREQRIMDYSLLIGLTRIGATRSQGRVINVLESRAAGYLVDQMPQSYPVPPKDQTSAEDHMSNTQPPKPLSSRQPPSILSLELEENRTRSSDPSTEEMEEADIYYLGLIDILQLYTTGKRLERKLKKFAGKDGKGISSTNPDKYQARFMRFVRESVFLAEEGPDQANVHADGQEQQGTASIPAGDDLSNPFRLGSSLAAS